MGKKAAIVARRAGAESIEMRKSGRAPTEKGKSLIKRSSKRLLNLREHDAVRIKRTGPVDVDDFAWAAYAANCQKVFLFACPLRTTAKSPGSRKCHAIHAANIHGLRLIPKFEW